MSGEAPNFKERDTRVITFETAEVRRWVWLPLFSVYCRILDISTSGVKLGFNYDLKAKPEELFNIVIEMRHESEGKRYFMKVPFSASCIWYDSDNRALGAKFTNLTPEKKVLINTYIYQENGH